MNREERIRTNPNIFMPVESENPDMETLDAGSGAAERVGSEWGLLPLMVGVVGTVSSTAEGASTCGFPRVP